MKIQTAVTLLSATILASPIKSKLYERGETTANEELHLPIHQLPTNPRNHFRSYYDEVGFSGYVDYTTHDDVQAVWLGSVLTQGLININCLGNRITLEFDHEAKTALPEVWGAELPLVVLVHHRFNTCIDYDFDGNFITAIGVVKLLKQVESDYPNFLVYEFEDLHYHDAIKDVEFSFTGKGKKSNRFPGARGSHPIVGVIDIDYNNRKLYADEQSQTSVTCTNCTFHYEVSWELKGGVKWFVEPWYDLQISGQGFLDINVRWDIFVGWQSPALNIISIPIPNAGINILNVLKCGILFDVDLTFSVRLESAVVIEMGTSVRHEKFYFNSGTKKAASLIGGKITPHLYAQTSSSKDPASVGFELTSAFNAEITVMHQGFEVGVGLSNMFTLPITFDEATGCINLDLVYTPSIFLAAKALISWPKLQFIGQNPSHIAGPWCLYKVPKVKRALLTLPAPVGVFTNYQK